MQWAADEVGNRQPEQKTFCCYSVSYLTEQRSSGTCCTPATLRATEAFNAPADRAAAGFAAGSFLWWGSRCSAGVAEAKTAASPQKSDRRNSKGSDYRQPEAAARSGPNCCCFACC